MHLLTNQDSYYQLKFKTDSDVSYSYLSLGPDSGRDTPPSLPPRERDTFVTPHEETDKPWGQRLLSERQDGSEGSPEDLQFR